MTRRSTRDSRRFSAIVAPAPQATDAFENAAVRDRELGDNVAIDDMVRARREHHARRDRLRDEHRWSETGRAKSVDDFLDERSVEGRAPRRAVTAALHDRS